MGFFTKGGKRTTKHKSGRGAAGQRRKLQRWELEEDWGDDAEYEDGYMDDEYYDDEPYDEEVYDEAYEDEEYEEYVDEEYADEAYEEYADEEYTDEAYEEYADDIEDPDAEEYYDEEYAEEGEYIEDQYAEDAAYVEDESDYGTYRDPDAALYEEASDADLTDTAALGLEGLEDELYGYEEEAEYEEDDYEPAYRSGSRSGTSRKSGSRKHGKKHKKSGLGAALGKVFADMGAMDKVLLFTAAAVFACIVFVGGAILTVRSMDEQVDSFASVGSDVEQINVIGESGLIAMNMAKLTAAQAGEIEESNSTEGIIVEEENAQVAVSMKATSIVKDLKLKFVNGTTGKLVANVPFEVTVTDPSGKTSTWTDDDKDGIIYKSEISGGTYKVQMVDLSATYENYTFDTSTKSIDVLAQIAYKTVDVSEEVKTEAEVNVSVEDTAVDTTTESELTDTVPFLESTSSSSTSGYQEIAKSSITDPSTTSSALKSSGLSIMRAANIYVPDATTVDKEVTTEDIYSLSLSATSASVQVKKTTTLTATAKKTTKTTTKTKTTVTEEDASGNNIGEGTTTEEVTTDTSDTDVTSSVTIEWSSSNTKIATVDSSGKITGVATGTATITAKIKDQTCDAATCSVTVTDGDSISLSATSLSVEVGKTATSTATLTPSTASISKVVSSDTNIATASFSGKTITVKGVKAGTCTITVTDSNSLTATIAVTVTGANAITLDNTSLTIVVGKTGTIKATTTPSNATISKVLSSDTNIATVSLSDKTITVTGVKAGTCTVTVTDSNSMSATCNITVKNSAETDTTTKLKDNSGRQVYVLDNGNYREAVYADYYKFSNFYIATSTTVYTGWQNINGNTYYYLADHTYVTGEQVIQGAKYTFNSDGILQTGSGILGIDVSKWNGTIDWNAVKNSGVSYVIIRCGYRGSSSGALIKDPKFDSNIKGATAAGLNVGVYFFSQAISEAEAIEEASMVTELVKGYSLKYPVFIDVEASNGRGDTIDSSTRTAVCKAFCATIQNAGYKAGVYSNKTWLNEKMSASSLSSYKIWLAQYASAPTYSGSYQMWQYSSKGTVAGISGNVDMNLSYLGY